MTSALACCRCGALHGQCYRGVSDALVLQRLTAEKVRPERWRYYNLMVVGSDDLSRGHGRLDPETRLPNHPSLPIDRQ